MIAHIYKDLRSVPNTERNNAYISRWGSKLPYLNTTIVMQALCQPKPHTAQLHSDAVDQGMPENLVGANSIVF